MITVSIDIEKCLGCGGCIDLCPAIAISMINDVVTIDEKLCTECSICVKVCSVRAPYKKDEK
jgi:ferredoxin